MPWDTTTFQNAEKIAYQGRIQMVFAENYPWHERIKKRKKVFPGGLRLVEALRTARQNGVGARPSVTMLLPEGGNPNISNIVVVPWDTYGRMQVSNRIIAQTDGDARAFAKAWADAIEDTLAAYTEDRARMHYGDGTGRIAMVNGAVVAATAINVDTPLNYATGAGSGNPLPGGSFYIRDNYRFTVGTNAELTGGVPVDLTVQNVTPTTAFTSTAAVSLGDNDIIVRGTGTTTSDHAFLNEPAGLLCSVDDRDAAAWGAVSAAGARWANTGGTADTYLGIPRTGASGVTRWQANRLAANGVLRTFQSLFIHDAMRRCKARGNGKPNVIVCNPVIKLEILQEIAPQFEYVPRRVEAGFEEITFNSGSGLSIIADDWCPPSVVFVLDESTFSYWQLTEPHWVDKGGGVQKWVINTNSFQAYMWGCDELVCENPAANAKIEDLQSGLAGIF